MANLQSPLPIRLAQTLGLTTSSLLAGASVAISIFAVPRLLESPPALLQRQWTHLFTAGKTFMPPLTILSSSAFFYLAYQAQSSAKLAQESKFWGYCTAGVLGVAIIPYTVVFMGATNGKLLAREVVEMGKGGESVHALVDWWGVLNLGRSAMLVLGAAVGAWTVVN